MRAVAAIGGEVEVVGRPEPTPGDREILVKVHAAGINNTDISRLNGQRQASAALNEEMLGVEFAGEVLATGLGVSRFEPGDRVMGLVAGGGQAEWVVTHELLAMRIPAEVDRSELVARRNDSELVVLDNEAWISPLRDEIKSVILNEIWLRMSGRKADAGAPPKIAIRINVQRFESVPASYALVQVAWRLTLSLPSKEVTGDCQTTAKIEVAPGVPALIRGHQLALAQVGDQVAAGIFELQREGNAPCPPQ